MTRREFTPDCNCWILDEENDVYVTISFIGIVSPGCVDHNERHYVYDVWTEVDKQCKYCGKLARRGR